MLLLAFVAARSTPNLPSLSVDLYLVAMGDNRVPRFQVPRRGREILEVPRFQGSSSTSQVPGGCGTPHGVEGGGMRHRGGAKCACRVDPSTSGGAAESTSSMDACNPPEGPVDVPTINAKPLAAIVGEPAHSSPYSFYPHVPCLMRRLPV
eukprot:scaffold74724_cov61-Phaeocystis_antarctica.AAC.1